VHRIRARLARRELVLESCAINPIVTNAVTLLKQEFKRAGVEVLMELDINLPMVRIDRIGIEQVISNLLRNACDAMQGITTRARVLCISTLMCQEPPQGGSGSWVTVAVSDRGRGLEGRDIEALTEPFFSTKKEGTGLGLAICRSILESHGGVLQAQDVPGGGARFSFSLPTESTTVEPRMP